MRLSVVYQEVVQIWRAMHSSRSDLVSVGTAEVWAYLLLRDLLLCCLAYFFWKMRPQTGLCSVSNLLACGSQSESESQSEESEESEESASMLMK